MKNSVFKNFRTLLIWVLFPLISASPSAHAEDPQCQPEEYTLVKETISDAHLDVACALDDGGPTDPEKKTKEEIELEKKRQKGRDNLRAALLKMGLGLQTLSRRESKEFKRSLKDLTKNSKNEWSKADRAILAERLDSAGKTAKIYAEWSAAVRVVEGRLNRPVPKGELSYREQWKIGDFDEIKLASLGEVYFRPEKGSKETLQEMKTRLLNEDPSLLGCQILEKEKKLDCVKAAFKYTYFDQASHTRVTPGKKPKFLGQKAVALCDWERAGPSSSRTKYVVEETPGKIDENFIFPLYKPKFFELKFTPKFYALSAEEQRKVLPRVYYNGYELYPEFPEDDGSNPGVIRPESDASSERKSPSLFGHSLAKYFTTVGRPKDDAFDKDKDFVILKYAEKTYPNGLLAPYVEDPLINYVEAVIVNGNEIPIAGQHKYVYKEVMPADKKAKAVAATGNVDKNMKKTIRGLVTNLEDAYKYTGWKMGIAP